MFNCYVALYDKYIIIASRGNLSNEVFYYYLLLLYIFIYLFTKHTPTCIIFTTYLLVFTSLTSVVNRITLALLCLITF